MAPEAVTTVACVGGGIIGGGWVCEFLRAGLEVRAYDPSPATRARLPEVVAEAWPTLEKLGLAHGADPARLTVHDTLAAAADGAHCVQESVPEDVAIKRAVFGDLDSALAPGVPVLSSISGSYTIAELTEGLANPERFVVAHPFNPPYLVPLVELVGGAGVTADAAIDWAFHFYGDARCGKFPLLCSNETPGYVANRLQDALWREALHMLVEGEATYEEIDAAVAYGPGLRWAAMGPLLTFYLAGGADGYRHFFDHFGPTLTQPWTRLVAPPISEEMQRLLVEGSERALRAEGLEPGADGARALMARRDDAIVATLAALKRHPRPVSFDGALRAADVAAASGAAPPTAKAGA